MPYEIRKDSRCGSDKPYAVVTKATGKVHGCHPTREHAQKQLRALYANAPE